ncbi:hypothetical protein BC940DRAFT_306728 [Gongronella butleri]|nr:hypothetical protein BC940DRAFT_306728 [Gongronella butleri]
MLFSKLIAVVPLIAAAVRAQQIAEVVDANNFCVFLPPPDSANRNIADTEWNAQTYCLGNAPNAKGANKLADGFILSAHYVATNTYVQVTGQIDPVKAKLNATDEGGQMDVAAPKGSSCAGWSLYVNMIEPATNTYCMRCCNDKVTCNRGISEKGCAHVIPGDYSGPLNGGSAGGLNPSGSTTPNTNVSVSASSSASASKAAAASGSASPAQKSNPPAGADANVSAQSVDNKSGAAGVVPTLAFTVVALAVSFLSQ